MMKPKKQTQREKFKALARALEADESEKVFDAALKKVATAKVAPQRAKAKPKQSDR